MAESFIDYKAEARRQRYLECEGWGTKVREQFELMDEGSLVGIIGTMKRGTGAHVLVQLDRLEYLGQPLAAA